MKTRPLPLAALLVCCLCLLIAVTVKKKHPTASAVSEDSFLLNAILPQFLGGLPKSFVAKRDTLPFKQCRGMLYSDAAREKDLSKAVPQEARAAFKDFARRNAASNVIPHLTLQPPLIVVENSEIEAVFKHGFWEAFYRKYPDTGGLLTITLPGYSADRTLAVVYIERSSGGLSGEGKLLLLKKENGEWMLVTRMGGWVS